MKRTDRFLLIAVLSVFAAACSPSEQQLAEIHSRVQTLEDREQIRQLFNDYGATLDRRDFAAFAQLFAADAEYVGGGATGSLRGPQAIKQALEETFATNPAGLGTPNFHVFFNEAIDVRGDRAVATSKSGFIVRDSDNQPDLVFLASYDDELIREHGQWKFLRRVVRSDIPAASR